MNKKLQTALTFDDVLLKPNFSSVLPKEVDLSINLSTKLLPIKPAPPVTTYFIYQANI